MCVTFTGIHRNSMTAQLFDRPDGKLDSAENTKHGHSVAVSHKHTHTHAAEQDT